MLLTWRATVFSLRNRSAATARLVLPAATRRSTSTSRAVSPPAALAGAFRDSASTRARSVAAPSCRKLQRAASSSMSAVSPSPSAPQASPIRTRTRAASYGASSSCQAVRARRRGIDLALGQAQERQTGLRLAPPAAGVAVGLLGLGELAAQPVQLGLLVAGRAGGGMSGRPAEAFPGPPDLVHGVGPGAMQQHDLGAVHLALPAVGDQVGL